MASSSSDKGPVAGAGSDALRWSWIGSGVLIGAVLLSLFTSIMQFSEKPAVAGFVVVLSIVVAGMLVGYYSHGETIRETAVAALCLVVLVGIISTTLLDVAIPTFVWFISPFLVPGMAMLGGWAGELLQGTLEEAYEDRLVDWPWVFCSIVLGFTLSAYAVLVGREVFDVTLDQSLWLFAGSFLITGWIVGFYSPGNTMVEPAIAAALMVVLDAGFVILWFDGLPAADILAKGFGAGIVLALVGAVLGELVQRKAGRRRTAPGDG
ncbi:MAG: hypothetical protein OEM96_09910 [Gemmatimonadota bacterium]|nr:hypothetical protein [Gemmatimonadota bacterium]